MKLIDMKWGYDGGGISCGPVAGSTIVEIKVEDENGEQYYVHNSRCGSFPCEYIVISKESGFEDAINQNWDEMMAYKESSKNDVFEYELGDHGEDEINSKFSEVMRLTQMAMEAYNSGADAEEWFKEYKGKDTSEVHILDFISGDGYGRAYLKECRQKCQDNEKLLEKLDEFAEYYLEKTSWKILKIFFWNF